MNEYLPPVVTRLLADISDLLTGLAEARAAVLAWATDIRSDVDSIMRDAGRDWGKSLGKSFKDEINQTLRGFDQDVDRDFVPQAAKNFVKAGASAGTGFAAAFKMLAMPMLILAIATSLPLLTTMVAAAISLGIGAAFVGLGAMLLKQEPALITAATRLRDTTLAVFKQAAMPMLAPMVKALDILTAGVQELGPQFSVIFAGIGAGLPDLATGLVGMFREMLPGLKELAPIIGQLLSALGGVLPDIGRGLSELFKSLVESAPAMIAFIQVFGKEFGHLLAIIGKVIKVFGDIFLFLNKIRTASKEGGWDTPWNAWAVALEKVWGWVKKVAGIVREWFGGVKTDAAGVGDSIVGKVRAAYERVVGLLRGIVDFVKSIPERVGSALAALPGLLADLAVRAFDGLMYWSGFAVAKVLQFLALLPVRMQMLAAQAWNFAVERFKLGVSTAVHIVSTVPGQVAVFLAQLRDNILMAVTQIAIDLFHWAGRVYHEALAWAARTVMDVGDWFGRLPERVSGAISWFIATVKGWFSNAKEWLAQAGKDVVNGLISGIMAAIDFAVNAIRWGMARIRQGARDALGIGSPSKVMHSDVGEPIGQGVGTGAVAGLERARKPVQAAIRALVNVSAGPALGALASQLSAARAGARTPDGPSMVSTTINLDGQRMITALTPAAQQRKLRTGVTGLA